MPGEQHSSAQHRHKHKHKHKHSVGAKRHALGGLFFERKAAIIMLTKTLVLELAPYWININSVGPGNTATPINEYIRTDPAYKSVLQDIVNSTPSGKAYSSVEDIANVVLFLASDAARALHGTFVLADEGYSAGADFSTSDYRTREQARADGFDHIERFYHPFRKHSKLNSLRPVQIDQQRLKS